MSLLRGRMKVLGTCVLLVGAVLILSRCGNRRNTKTLASPGTFTNVYEVTLKTACIECHVPNGAATKDNKVKLDFTDKAKAHKTLTESSVSGTVSVGTCSKVKIVVAKKANESYLAGVLFKDYHKDNFVQSGCTPYSVHLEDQNLSKEEKSSIIDWIQNGAKND